MNPIPFVLILQLLSGEDVVIDMHSKLACQAARQELSHDKLRGAICVPQAEAAAAGFTATPVDQVPTFVFSHGPETAL